MSVLETTSSRPRSLWWAGAIAAVAAAAGNLVVMVVSQTLLGVTLQVPAQPGSAELMALPLVAVVGASVVPAIGATVLLALLIRFVSRPVRLFQGIGLVFLLLSFVPVLGIPVATSVKVVLGVMHVVAGVAILWPLSVAARR